MFCHILALLMASTVAVHAHPRLLAAAARPSPALNDFLSEAAGLEIRGTNGTSALLSASVTLCTEKNLKGDCAVAVWPVNQCIDLRGYAGEVQSFIPAEGFECLLMQNRCDATVPYAEIGSKDTKEGSDLSGLEWIKESASYICFTELKALQRFVRMSRLRVTDASQVDATSG